MSTHYHYYGERHFKPLTIREAAYHVSKKASFPMVFGDFLDQFYESDKKQKKCAIKRSISSPSCIIVPLECSFLAAAAAQLSVDFNLPYPKWTNDPKYILREPFFGSDGFIPKEENIDSFYNEALSELKKRNIIMGGEALARNGIYCPSKHQK